MVDITCVYEHDNYCHYCGNKTVSYTKNRKRYSKRTGEELLMIVYMCPNKKIFFDGHYKYVVDQSKLYE